MESSFVLYTEAWEAIALLSDVQRSALMQAMFSHHGACEMPDMDPMTKAIFLMMRPRFEANKAKYQEICEKRKVAGQKGGIAKGESSVAKKQMLICQKQNSHLDLDPDIDLEDINTPPYPPRGESGDSKAFSDSSILPNVPEPTALPKAKTKTREPTGNSLPELRQLVADYTQFEPLRKILEDFRLMRERIRKPMTGQALKLVLLELDKLARGDPEKIAVLEQSILNSWQGVFAVKGSFKAESTLEKNMETGARVLAMREQRRQNAQTAY